MKTSAFQPFGKTADTAKGAVKANGTILRMNPDGSGLEVYAWGLRNCELHLFQARGDAPAVKGVWMPTFMPETG